MLARPSSNCKLHSRLLLREGAPHQQTRDYLTEVKTWSWAPDGGLTPRLPVMSQLADGN
jgi:hypothetical protein